MSWGFDGRPGEDDFCVAGGSAWADGAGAMAAIHGLLRAAGDDGDDTTFGERPRGVHALRCEGEADADGP